MAAQVRIHYDAIGDILYVDKCEPYGEQESTEVGDGIVARLNPHTGEIETLEILSYSHRDPAHQIFEFPSLDMAAVANALEQRAQAA